VRGIFFVELFERTHFQFLTSFSFYKVKNRMHYLDPIFKDDCKVGPATDEHSLVNTLTELRTAWKSDPNKKWELAMEISAKKVNIYMGVISK